VILFQDIALVDTQGVHPQGCSYAVEVEPRLATPFDVEITLVRTCNSYEIPQVLLYEKETTVQQANLASRSLQSPKRTTDTQDSVICCVLDIALDHLVSIRGEDLNQTQ
jgi:hypothetical protein